MQCTDPNDCTNYESILAGISKGQPAMEFQPKDASLFNDNFPSIGEIAGVISDLHYAVKQLQIDVESLKIMSQAR